MAYSYSGRYDLDFNEIVGKNITEVHMDDENLVFITEDGDVIGYGVAADCCSWSYFHDFVGLEKLLKNGPVKEFNNVDLEVDDRGRNHDECVQAYGYELVTEHEKWGDQTTVFSFRNESNGYYGGSMYRTNRIPASFYEGGNKLTEDKL